MNVHRWLAITPTVHYRLLGLRVRLALAVKLGSIRRHEKPQYLFSLHFTPLLLLIVI